MPVDTALLDLFAAQRGGTLLTIKRDGRPQASVVSHAFDAATRTLRVDHRAACQDPQPAL